VVASLLQALSVVTASNRVPLAPKHKPITSQNDQSCLPLVILGGFVVDLQIADSLFNQ
jgi:hypothetical protein